MRLVRHRYGTSIVAVFLLASDRDRQSQARTRPPFEGQRIVNVAFEPPRTTARADANCLKSCR